MPSGDYIFKTKRKGEKFELLNREISWLAFNDRVLQEAAADDVPLLERIKFLAIFSSNLDEFFRIRVPSLRKLNSLSKVDREKLNFNPELILQLIQDVVIRQQNRFERLFEQAILPALSENGIRLVNEKELSTAQQEEVRLIFKQQILPYTTPIMLTGTSVTPHLKDRYIYLAVKMYNHSKGKEAGYGLVELPTKFIPRFFQLNTQSGNTHDIILLDDVVRFNLNYLFGVFSYDTLESFTIKLTRNQELDVDNDIYESVLDKLNKSLKARKKGEPVRFIHDARIPTDLLNLIIRKFKLEKANIIPGGRYHNFSDFMNFPDTGNSELKYPGLEQLPHQLLDHYVSMFDAIRTQDVMVHHPYQSFDYVLRFLREAAIDPTVTEIKITLYRIARLSQVANSLVTAAMNGKKVTAIIELKARFDEETNMYWAEKLDEAGVKVIYGFHNLKVHCKMCLISRNEKGRIVQYAHFSTGNYNGQSARIYSDFGLFTHDNRLIKDADKLFRWLENSARNYEYEHLLVAPNHLREGFVQLIQKEIANAKAGKPAWMKLKMNSLVDEGMIELLYEASRAGVKIELIVRGMCSLVPGVKQMSENIRVISIIDRFLEHGRLYIFANGENGREKVFLSSADWMNRNLSNRVEIAFPIYDKNIRKNLIQIFDLQWSDNCRARIIDATLKNERVLPEEHNMVVRSQWQISDLLNVSQPSIKVKKKAIKKQEIQES